MPLNYSNNRTRTTKQLNPTRGLYTYIVPTSYYVIMSLVMERFGLVITTVCAWFNAKTARKNSIICEVITRVVHTLERSGQQYTITITS